MSEYNDSDHEGDYEIMKSHVKQFQSWGLKLIPLNDDTKKPKTKLVNGSYRWKPSNGAKWTEEDISAANTLGVIHQESNVIDCDFDDPSAQKFINMLPETLTIGKKVKGGAVATHKIYTYSGKTKSISYGKKTDYGCQVELLTNGQTRVLGDDRVVINDVRPKVLTHTEYVELNKTLKKIYNLAILSKHYPEKGLHKRDEFVFRVAGTLAHECKHWELYEKEDFIEQLITANGDTDEYSNRLNKVGAQEENLKLGKEVAGVKSLCEFLGIKQLECIDHLRKEEIKGITVLKFSEFLQRKYPPVNYVIYPLMATETIIQVWSMPGIGKTWFGLELAASVASGKEFLRWKSTKDLDKKPVAYPVLYVEGEMRASSLRDRIVDIQSSMPGFDFNYFNIAPIAEQPNETFEPLNEEKGRANVEIRLQQIFEETGKKPFLFLDNISCLTSIQEKDGVEWISFMSWLVKLRARGYTVIFFHHSTKEGSTSSGSNMKERAVDIEVKLERPDKDEYLDGYTGAQFKVSFPKWREFANSQHAAPFIATLDRNTHEWKTHDILKKTKRKVKNALETSGGDIKATMEATGLSQAQVYRYMKDINSQTRELNKKDYQGHKRGFVSASTKTRIRKHNRAIVEEKVLKEIKQSSTINGVTYEETREE
jgi:hypothetical protein